MQRNLFFERDVKKGIENEWDTKIRKNTQNTKIKYKSVIKLAVTNVELTYKLSDSLTVEGIAERDDKATFREI